MSKSTKEFKDFVLEQLSEVPNNFCRPMMGGYLLYSDDVLFGGIYSDRLLVKMVPENEKYQMTEVVPYEGSKKIMYFVEDLEDKKKLAEIVNDTVKGISSNNQEQHEQKQSDITNSQNTSS